MGACSGAIFIRLCDVIGRDRDQPAIADFHFAIALNKTFSLPAIFWAIAAAAQNQNQRILLLQIGKLPTFSGLIREFVIREFGSGNNVSSHRKSSAVFC